LTQEEIPQAGRSPEITALDISALRREDLANLILQRSEVIAD